MFLVLQGVMVVLPPFGGYYVTYSTPRTLLFPILYAIWPLLLHVHFVVVEVSKNFVPFLLLDLLDFYFTQWFGSTNGRLPILQPVLHPRPPRAEQNTSQQEQGQHNADDYDSFFFSAGERLFVPGRRDARRRICSTHEQSPPPSSPSPRQ